MGIVPRDGLRVGTRAVMFLLAVMVVSMLWGPRPGQAADLRIVTGSVKSVSATELEVGGQTYNISGVPIRTATRQPVSSSQLAPGTKVDLHFRGGKLVLVYVYPNIVE